MLDYHCHILPGLDDGADDLEEALAMGRLLAGGGFRRVCCTPHCMRGAYETTPEMVRAGIARLGERLAAEGVTLELLPGMEYYLDEFFLDLEVLQPLGATGLLLVEAPGQASAEVVAAGLEKVIACGYTPLVAHPERTPLFQVPAADLPALAPGALFQGNIGAFTGSYGPAVQQQAYALLRGARYHRLGSDAHAPAQLTQMIPAFRHKLEVNPALKRLSDEQ